jgi:hypothetical protein
VREETFAPIDQLFTEFFGQVADEINRDFEHVTCRAYSNFPPNHYDPGVGYFSMLIDCLIDDVPDDKSDNLALGISVFDQDSILTIEADVCWGSGKVEGEIFEKPVVVSDETLSQLKEQLPALVQKLRDAIRKYPNGR